MSELQRCVDKLVLQVDRMALHVQEALKQALRAARDCDVETGMRVDEDDNLIDREEVEIEKECIRLLALYQPTAVDMRRIFYIAKVNNDLERIADLAARIGRYSKLLYSDGLRIEDYPDFTDLSEAVGEVLSHTIRLLGQPDLEDAKRVIAGDSRVNEAYNRFLATVLDAYHGEDELEPTLNLLTLAKTLERIGDHCTNIAEDAIFVTTGDIVRHSQQVAEIRSKASGG